MQQGFIYMVPPCLRSGLKHNKEKENKIYLYKASYCAKWLSKYGNWVSIYRRPHIGFYFTVWSGGGVGDSGLCYFHTPPCPHFKQHFFSVQSFTVVYSHTPFFLAVHRPSSEAASWYAIGPVSFWTRVCSPVTIIWIVYCYPMVTSNLVSRARKETLCYYGKYISTPPPPCICAHQLWSMPDGVLA